MVVLLNAFIDVFKNSITRRDQLIESLWNRSTDIYEQIERGIYRTKDGIYSKFSPMNNEVVYFLRLLNKNTIYCVEEVVGVTKT